MFERFTQAARATVAEAMAQAKELGSSHFRPEHFVLAMLGPQGFFPGLGYSYPEARALVEAAGGADQRDDTQALRAIGIDLEAVREAVAANFGPDAWMYAATSRVVACSASAVTSPSTRLRARRWSCRRVRQSPWISAASRSGTSSSG